MHETKVMIVASLLLLLLGYGLMWYFGVFQGLGFHGTVAAVLGVSLTTIVGVAVMSLLFHSARTGHDKAAQDTWRNRK